MRYNLRENHKVEPYRKQLSVNGHDIMFEIDTGAGLTIMNEKTYRQMGHGKPKNKTLHINQRQSRSVRKDGCTSQLQRTDEAVAIAISKRGGSKPDGESLAQVS